MTSSPEIYGFTIKRKPRKKLTKIELLDEITHCVDQCFFPTDNTLKRFYLDWAKECFMLLRNNFKIQKGEQDG